MIGDWTCPTCKMLVFASKKECFKCNTPPGGVCFRFWNGVPCTDKPCSFRHVRKPHACSAQEHAQAAPRSIPASAAPAPENHVSHKGHETKANSTAAVRAPQLPPPWGVCWMFWKTGHCELGAACTFKHTTPPQHPNPLVPAAAQATATLAQWRRRDHVNAECSKRRKGHNLSIAEFHTVQVSLTPSIHAADSEAAAAGHGNEHVLDHGGARDSNAPRHTPKHREVLEGAVLKLMALTAHETRQPVPDAHSHWLRELLLDVQLATGYPAPRVLGVTRNILRYLIHTLTGHGVRETEDKHDDGDIRKCGGSKYSSASGRWRQVFGLLHAVKVVSIGSLLEAAVFVRTQEQEG